MSNRLVSLDWLRSICIIFILLIHIFDDYAQNQVFSIKYVTSLGIEAFVRLGLPLFFILSGFLLIKPYENAQAFKNFYQRRLLRILPLFLFWSFIYYLYSKQSFELLDFFRCIVTEPVFYHLWFVYAILGIYIVTPLISNIVVKSKSQAVFLYCIISISVYTFEPVFKFFNINSYFYQFFLQFWFIYFIGGYCLRQFLANQEKYTLFFENCQLIFIISVLFVYFISLFKPNSFYPWTQEIALKPYDSNLFMCLACFSFFIIVYKKLTFTPPKIFNFIAEKSYGIYLSHALFLSIYRNNCPISTWYVNIFVEFIFVLACCLLTEVIIDFLLSMFSKVFIKYCKNCSGK